MGYILYTGDINIYIIWDKEHIFKPIWDFVLYIF